MNNITWEEVDEVPRVSKYSREAEKFCADWDGESRKVTGLANRFEANKFSAAVRYHLDQYGAVIDKKTRSVWDEQNNWLYIWQVVPPKGAKGGRR